MNNFLVYSRYVFGTFVPWYSFFVLVGALASYFVANYFYKKEPLFKEKPSLIDDLFIIVFPAGIIGARIWFVISEWEYYSKNFSDIFRIWEGGLAIQGGVMAGIIAGVIYHKLAKIKISAFRLADIIIPNILLAQAIGRWGNFFNQEVYGECVNKDQLRFIPDFILKNMDGGQIDCGINMVAQPLFLYESLLNLAGFIIISIVLRRFYTRRIDGDLSGLYMIWYGFFRILLEPLRKEEFIMKIFDNISLSILTSAFFILTGIALVISLRLIPYINRRKKDIKNG